VYLTEAKDLPFVKDIITKYQDAPLKAFIGKEACAEAGTFKAKAFTIEQKGELLQHLNTEYATLDEIMRKAFKAFDLDGSGYIDSNELAEVSKELGKALDSAELDECLKDLDQNKDGKISYEEFSQWWLSGRQGLSKAMRRLLAIKLKTLQFMDSISGTLKETIQEAATQQVDIS